MLILLTEIMADYLERHTKQKQFTAGFKRGCVCIVLYFQRMSEVIANCFATIHSIRHNKTSAAHIACTVRRYVIA
jgi:hypothetical protein